jgi:hypothetical protein
MNEQVFWMLIDSSRAESQPAQSNQPEILAKKLSALPPDEILEFDKQFRGLHRRAYRWDLWAAAYIIEGGCSDDGFSDFRAGLIGLGREAYEDALRDPATLERQPSRGVDFSQEALLYAASEAYWKATGRPMPESDLEEPDEPVGRKWDVSLVGRIYPGLARKFGFNG